MWQILGNILVGPIVNAVAGVASTYITNETDRQKFKAELEKSVWSVFENVAKSNNEAATKMFTEFQRTLQTTKVVQLVWAYWVASQITFIIWLEVGVPWVAYYTGNPYPGVGALDQWAYAGVMGALGLGPLVIKHTMKPPSV